MPLKIFLLGQFKLTAHDSPIELQSRPAQSLLAYLVLNAGIAHRREKLAGLLWPDADESNTRSYLRQALWRIRKSLESGALQGEDYLEINEISVAFNHQSDYWLDAEALLGPAEGKSIEEIVEIIRLFKGELLPGFYDEWVVLERDRLHAAYYQKMNYLLERLIQAGQWNDVLIWSEEWIRQGFSPEQAYRALMTAHAGLGNLGMIGPTYQRCVEALKRELGAEPSPETIRLYEQIRRGQLEGLTPLPSPPAALKDQQPYFFAKGVARQVERTLFVAREGELAQLSRALDTAISGQGRVIFVTGEAGSGKTSLVNEFVRRAQEENRNLAVAWGNCNAHTGMGDPYLPFREILELLTGDVEARWSAGAISKEHARFLWNMLPFTSQALMEVGPDLVDTFIQGTGLLERAIEYAQGGAEWVEHLEKFMRRKETDPALRTHRQSDLFLQYYKVLENLAYLHPIVLIIDDLQWADLGSISLLFHLGRKLTGSRVLIVGALRPEEVALGRAGERHPLEPLINEFQRIFGEAIVNIDQARNREFIDAILNSEPNQLGPSFRQMLYYQTRGHPLVTVELLRGMQERGDLVQDQDGRWMEAANLDWETLPARVEAVIAERIGRLEAPLQAILLAASVEGEVFTAEVISEALASGDRELLRYLSGELDKKHRLIRAQSIQRVGGKLISSYRFQHILVQKYLYNSLDEVERVHMHERVGMALEDLYAHQESAMTIAPQLARHFLEARITEKALIYLQQAAERAQKLSAYNEAIGHATRGLALLADLPEKQGHALQELSLQMVYGIALQGTSGTADPKIELALKRAQELCQATGKTTQLCRVLYGLSIHQYVRGRHRRALELAERSLSLSQHAGDVMLAAVGHWNVGLVLFALGEYVQSRDHLKPLIDLYEPDQHHQEFVYLRGVDAGLSGLAYDACCLYALGFPEQAANRSQQAIALTRRFNHQFTLADVLCYAGCQVSRMQRDAHDLLKYADELIGLAQANCFSGWLAAGNIAKGEALIMLGRILDGLPLLEEGLASFQILGTYLHLPGYHSTQALAYAYMGDTQKGSRLIAQAFELLERSGERLWEAELYRVRAELHLMQSEEDQAESDLRQSLDVAHRQNARSWELRTAIDLASLWQKQGRLDEAGRLLSELYDCFTEGFETPDLRKAHALLAALS
jgi:DNA-binding SARP family transcriptional activator/predicted ATPase